MNKLHKVFFISAIFLCFLTSCNGKNTFNGNIFLTTRVNKTSSLITEHSADQNYLKINTSPVLIVIDPGHGGDDDGCSHKDIVDEKELTLVVACLVRDNLINMGYQVIMTRDKDAHLDLDERVQKANQLMCDLFVSIHFNSAKNTKAHGIEVFYCDCADKFKKEESKEVAENILEKLIYFTKAKSRGVKIANFRVIKNTKMPAVLVEGGFLSNNEERAKCQDSLYQEVLAWGIARGVHEYLKKKI
jgi:N-acetylmuramoyl-L-alanine amidase